MIGGCMHFDRIGVVDTTTSPHARLRGVAMNGVTLEDGFWSRRRAMNRNQALAHGHRKLVDVGALHNFAVAAGRISGEYRSLRFADSDLYKWLEAAACLLAEQDDATIRRKVDEIIDLLAAAQRADGYLNTFHQIVRPDRRWTNLRDDHELYCAGHLFQAAIAHFRATGRDALLDVARRFADHVVAAFGPGRREAVPGHPEIEMALVELYRCTGEQAYLAQAKRFVDLRGTGLIGGEAEHQDHVAVRDAPEMAGHAVRQLYLLCGVADLHAETGEPALAQTLQRLWMDMTQHKMAITGGVGARHEQEAFGASYELPNDRCYNETCAQIASVMWNWRMLLTTGESRFADLMEWTLYNGVLPGISLDGGRYFYVNPLLSRGGVARREWYTCACCPPNVMRTLACLPGYVASTSAAEVQLHLYDRCHVRARLDAGAVHLAVDTSYPWEGRISCTVERCPDRPWSLALRVPGWATGARVAVNDGAPAAVAAGRYAAVERSWQPGDRVVLDLDLRARFMEAHPYVDAARGCAAVTRGPLVYCAEQADQAAGAHVLDCAVDAARAPETAWDDDLLGGLMTLRLAGSRAPAPASDRMLYRSWGTHEEAPAAPVTLTAIPYYAWANRDPGPMNVWMPSVR